MKTEPRAPYDTNRVVSFEPQKNGRNLYVAKETVRELIYTCIVDGEIETPIKLTWWMGRSKSASRVFCTVWIGFKNTHASGHGQASGYGYDKESAAANEAIESAGVKLTKPFGGCGERPTRIAVRAIAEHLGLPADGKFF